MNPWPFVIAAYILTLVGAAALSLWSFIAMRRAEGRADEMKRDR